MEGYNLYEDLSLFNGDLLLEPLSDEAPQQQYVKDEGINVFESPKASSVLANPQHGSGELGLSDLLVSSPTVDLSDPFSPKTSWMDTNVDLLDLLASHSSWTETPNQHPAQEESQAHEDATLQQMFDFPAVDDIQVSNVAFTPDNVPHPTDEEMNILNEINDTGIQQLIKSTIGDIFAIDAPILSPVSAEDIDSLLSSNPPSPADLSPISAQFSPNSSQSSYNTDSSFEEYSPKSKKARSAPYNKGQKKTPDRKERKKEQNRTAALKYRQKKRDEKGTLHEEYEELEIKNKELKEKVESMTREIKYLKDLMAEVHKVRAKVKKRSV